MNRHGVDDDRGLARARAGAHAGARACRRARARARAHAHFLEPKAAALTEPAVEIACPTARAEASLAWRCPLRGCQLGPQALDLRVLGMVRLVRG